MAQNKIVRFGPVALTTTLTTNILNPQTLTGGVTAGTSNTNTVMFIKYIKIGNKTASAATVSLWIGATGANAAGTEVPGLNAVSVPANSYVLVPFANLRLDVADFLVGGAGTTTALTFEAEGEIGIA